MRRLARVALLAVSIAAWAASAVAQPAGPREISVMTPDGARRALVLDGGSGTTLRPVVLLFHGHGGGADNILGAGGLVPSPLSSWADIARREGLLVVALDGLKGPDHQRGWNDCRADADDNQPVADDVAFARAVVAQLESQSHGDPARILAMGMSNGGMMVFRLALQMPELAAFAAVSASMASVSKCPEAPRAEVAALIISGDADPLVPFAGGQVGLRKARPRGGVIPVPEAFERWVRAHGQDPTGANQTLLRPTLAGDATVAKLRYLGPTLAQSDVAMVRVAGGGHVEPSLAHRYGGLYLRLVGPQSAAFESAELAWEFFRDKHRKP
jgi:polyhydroxybutyrate depolymerase